MVVSQLASVAELTYVAVNIPIAVGLEPVLDNLGSGHHATTLGGLSGSCFRIPVRQVELVV